MNKENADEDAYEEVQPGRRSLTKLLDNTKMSVRNKPA